MTRLSRKVCREKTCAKRCASTCVRCRASCRWPVVKILHPPDLGCLNCDAWVKRKLVVRKSRVGWNERADKRKPRCRNGGTQSAWGTAAEPVGGCDGQAAIVGASRVDDARAGARSAVVAELGVALEAFRGRGAGNADITGIVSVPELQKTIAQWGRRKPQKDEKKDQLKKKKKKADWRATDDRWCFPTGWCGRGNHGLNVGQRALQ